MSDIMINLLKTTTYRASGQATYPAITDITRYWSASCVYNSAQQATGVCASAYRDANLTDATGYTNSNSGWYGLSSGNTGSINEIGTSVVGDHVYAGTPDDYTHSFSGRPSEDPSLQFWVK